MHTTRKVDGAPSPDESGWLVTAGPDMKDEPPGLVVGSHLGRYLVIGELGRGGMGVVVRAYDPRLQREVALKCLRPGLLSDTTHARLVREAQAMAKLNHRNVVGVYDVEANDDRVVLVMECVEGPTLGAWLREGPRSWREVVRAFLGAGRGLQASHDAGLLHRDFKPENVLMARGGEPKVTDFGIARIGSTTDSSANEESSRVGSRDAQPQRVSSGEHPSTPELTQAGQVVGTLAYMAPEQHRGDPLTAAADQYAFCVSLWRGLTAELPFSSARSELECARLKHRGPPPWPKAGAGVPRRIVDAVTRGLSPEPEARWPSMAALLDALEYDPTQRRRRALAFAAVIGVVLGGIGWRGYDRARIVDACEREGASIRDSWNDGHAQAITAAFEATGIPYAANTWSRARPKVDAFVDEWERLRTQACLEGELEGVRRPELLARARECFDEHRARLGELVERWQHPDRATVNYAASSAWAMTGLASCLDEVELARRDPVVEDPTNAAAVKRLRDQLAQATAVGGIGRYDDALALAMPIPDEATTLAQPGLALAARIAVGRLQSDAGRYDEAQLTLEQAYRAAEARGDDTQAFAAANTLISVAAHRARPADAERWFWLTEVKQGRMAQNEGHPRQADALNNMGLAFEAQGRPAEALELHQRALEIRERTLGPDHPYVASSLNNIGVCLGSVGRSQEALEPYERALAIWEQALGPSHPEAAKALGNLGVEHLILGHHEQAVDFLQRGLSIQELALGPDHPDVATSRLGLAAAYSSLGRHEEAVAAGERAVATLEKALGPDHPPLADWLGNLGLFHQQAGHDDDALATYQRALALTERTLPPGDDRIATRLLAVGDALVALERHAEAMLVLERGLEILDEAGKPPSALAKLRWILAKAAWGHGEHVRARELAAQALAHPPASPSDLPATIEAWLATHGPDAPAQ